MIHDGNNLAPLSIRTGASSAYASLPVGLKLPYDALMKKYPHTSFRVRTLAEYLQVIKCLHDTNVDDEARLVFRGMDDYTYSLKPSLGVLCDRDDYVEPTYNTIENELIMDMITQRPEEFHSSMSNLDLLAKMQHYGIPTRLLDFTFNPLVALYFTCSSNQKKTGRVVCTKDTSTSSSDRLNVIESLCGLYKVHDYQSVFLEDIIKTAAPITSYYVATMEPIMVHPKYYSERIKRQMGLFMVFPNEIWDKSQQIIHDDDQAIMPVYYDNDAGRRKLEIIKKREPIGDIYPSTQQVPKGEPLSGYEMLVTADSLSKIFNKHRESSYDSFQENSDEFNIIMHKRFEIVDCVASVPDKIIREQFCSILIEPEDKQAIMSELDQVGINKAFLFPELEYTAERIKANHLSKY